MKTSYHNEQYRYQFHNKDLFSGGVYQAVLFHYVFLYCNWVVNCRVLAVHLVLLIQVIAWILDINENEWFSIERAITSNERRMTRSRTPAIGCRCIITQWISDTRHQWLSDARWVSSFELLDTGLHKKFRHVQRRSKAIGLYYIYDYMQWRSGLICVGYLLNGGTCGPVSDQRVLVAWTLCTCTADILLIYHRPTFHFWIPEWRTIFVSFYISFFFIDMGSCVCCYLNHGSLQ